MLLGYLLQNIDSGMPVAELTRTTVAGQGHPWLIQDVEEGLFILGVTAAQKLQVSFRILFIIERFNGITCHLAVGPPSYLIGIVFLLSLIQFMTSDKRPGRGQDTSQAFAGFDRRIDLITTFI